MVSPVTLRTSHFGVARTAVLLALIEALAAQSAPAQTDYYNTDAGRPIAIEDASPIERRAFEIQAAPLRLERTRPGVYTWGFEPEIAHGILPRTQVELGFPLALVDAGTRRSGGLAGIELSVLHNLNVETSIPALTIAADVLLPAGNLGPDRTYTSVKAIGTRTFTWARLHANVGYSFGDEPDASAAAPTIEVSRWLAGLAVDRAFPLRSSLITAEIVARQPIRADEPVEWSVGAGVRRQLATRWAVDGGVGRRLTGEETAWYATVGSAFAFGLPWRPR